MCITLYAAVDRPTGLTAEQLPQESGSFRVSWTPPASLANLTGYRVYYSGAGDSGSIDVGASTTEVTIDNRIAGVTYSITMVALSPHLPSPVVGPVSVILGEIVASPLTVLLNLLGKNDCNIQTDTILTKLGMDLILKTVCGVNCFKGQVLLMKVH